MSAIGPIQPGLALAAGQGPSSAIAERPIAPFEPVAPVEQGIPGLGVATGGVPQVSFSEVLSHFVENANVHAVRADQAAQAFASGVRDDIHGTMIAIKEADIELRLVSSVRNKLVDAFNELWRMNV